MYTYLLINLCSIALPLALSFESRIQFWKKWSALFIAISLTGSFFLIWDSLFTSWGIWGFNPKYLTGISLGNLPIEEVLFFVCIPYSCLFAYEALNLLKIQKIDPYAEQITIAIAGTLTVCVFLCCDQLYTSVCFGLTAVFLFLIRWMINTPYLGRFFVAYAVNLIPFFIVNGLLTGTYVDEPVVWYNNAENLSIRMGTIPIEDTVYMLLLLLMNTTIYERIKKRSSLP